jgi:hypothetical protein
MEDKPCFLDGFNGMASERNAMFQISSEVLPGTEWSRWAGRRNGDLDGSVDQLRGWKVTQTVFFLM